MAPTSVLPEWLAEAVDALAAGDIERWMSIYAPDAIQEYPWASEGRVRRLEGREAIAAHMSQLPTHVKFGPLDDVQVREVGDETIVQATGHHRLPDGTPSDHGHIWFITRRDNRVTRWQDYATQLQISRP
jgi:uncharacterized protein